MKRYKALAFDFDGTLFDTHRVNFEAYQSAYRDLGIEITQEQFERTHGKSVYDFNEILGVDCDVEKLRQLKSEYYKKSVLEARPNEYLIYVMRNCHLPVAIVTTARLRNIMPLLYKYGLADFVDVLVTQEDVQGRFKPDSYAYQLAFEQLGVEAKDVMVFEDEQVGIIAARNAGADVIKISKFHVNCIADISGGSDAHTRLFWGFRDCCPKVRKMAYGDARLKLEEQCEFLRKQDYPFVKVLSYSEFENVYEYSMEFIPGMELYRHPNRTQLFARAMEIVAGVTRVGIYADSRYKEIRKDCYETYIAPGMKIYEEVTGDKKTIPFFSWEDIPELVCYFDYAPCHGDTTLENIMVSSDGQMYLIDPVPKNVVSGRVHDFSKLLQSLYGYEKIRDEGECSAEEYAAEKDIFNDNARKFLSETEYNSLKFFTACLFFRRLKYQVRQNKDLVKVYGDIAFRLMDEFVKKDYVIK